MAKPNTPILTHLQLPLPEPLFTHPYQSGITDPMWPEIYPGTLDPQVLREYLEYQMEANRLESFNAQPPNKQELKNNYQSDYAGRVARQGFQSIIRMDVLAQNRDELKKVLVLLSKFTIEEMNKKPSQKHIRFLEPIPDSYRVTITVGFGASLFVDKTGFDRFGLRSQKPKCLKTMPSFEGDHECLHPTRSASDLLLVVSSDHPYINVAVVRYFAEFFNKKFSAQHHKDISRHDVLKFEDVQEGFARKDKREFLKFDDGIENLQIDPAELRRLVYVDESDNEPSWCLHGTYLVYRKIRERMPTWETLTDPQQEGMIGRYKEACPAVGIKAGEPLSRAKAGKDRMIPVYPDPADPRDGPLTAHIRKVQPRRPEPDLFGLHDQERRFLRRPYPFFDGLDKNGQAINGLHFIAFMKSIQRQFEHIVNMWQMNPDFPVPNTGVDALYANGVLSTIDGGYYFCPPGLKDVDDFFGSGMFDD